MHNQDWRDYIESEEYQIGKSRELLGCVNVAKLLNGHLLHSPMGGNPLNGELDSYAQPYRCMGVHFVKPENYLANLPTKLGAFYAERRGDSRSEVNIFCSPADRVNGKYIGELSIEADFFRENALFYVENAHQRELVFQMLKDEINGVRYVGERPYIFIPIRDFSGESGKVKIEYDKK